MSSIVTAARAARDQYRLRHDPGLSAGEVVIASISKQVKEGGPKGLGHASHPLPSKSTLGPYAWNLMVAHVTGSLGAIGVRTQLTYLGPDQYAISATW
jgi:hypothetical protein